MEKVYIFLKRTIILLIILIFLFLIGFCGISFLNYRNGLSEMNEQRFISAYLYFDKIPFVEKLFPKEWAYISAGVLLEEGKYVESLKHFQNLDFPIHVSIIDTLTSKIYSEGRAAYKNNDLDTAVMHFREIRDYKRSSDYLLLISCKKFSFNSPEDKYSRLVELISFEDAEEIIIQNEGYAKRFLRGRWEDGEKYDPFYFELDSENHATYNLPHNSSDGYFYLTGGIYSVGESESDAIKYFRFRIIDKDTISVYCYKDGSTYKLYRQQ